MIDKSRLYNIKKGKKNRYIIVGLTMTHHRNLGGSKWGETTGSNFDLK